VQRCEHGGHHIGGQMFSQPGEPGIGVGDHRDVRVIPFVPAAGMGNRGQGNTFEGVFDGYSPARKGSVPSVEIITKNAAPLLPDTAFNAEAYGSNRVMNKRFTRSGTGPVPESSPKKETRVRSHATRVLASDGAVTYSAAAGSGAGAVVGATVLPSARSSMMA
jgi:hypothetical protein